MRPPRFNAAFWRWFGKSVVTKTGKAGGEPLVVYHGTPRFGFTRFRGLNYFTADPGAASFYAWWPREGKTRAVYAVYLRIERPYKAFAGLDVGFEMDDLKYDHKRIRKLKAQGYDGATDGSQWLAFSPTQIKSATGNRGTWSPTDPDIMRNPGGMDAVEKMWRGENNRAARRDALKSEVLARLRKIGPNSAVVRLGEALSGDISCLRKRGMEYGARSARPFRMQPIACHSNSSQLYDEDPENTTIVTGYGLGPKDNLWREHTWVLRNGRVVETTARRRAYFGYPLTKRQAVAFAAANRSVRRNPMKKRARRNPLAYAVKWRMGPKQRWDAVYHSSLRDAKEHFAAIAKWPGVWVIFLEDTRTRKPVFFWPPVKKNPRKAHKASSRFPDFPASRNPQSELAYLRKLNPARLRRQDVDTIEKAAAMRAGKLKMSSRERDEWSRLYGMGRSHWQDLQRDQELEQKCLRLGGYRPGKLWADTRGDAQKVLTRVKREGKDFEGKVRAFITRQSGGKVATNPGPIEVPRLLPGKGVVGPDFHDCINTGRAPAVFRLKDGSYVVSERDRGPDMESIFRTASLAIAVEPHKRVVKVRDGKRKFKLWRFMTRGPAVRKFQALVEERHEVNRQMKEEERAEARELAQGVAP